MYKDGEKDVNCMQVLPESIDFNFIFIWLVGVQGQNCA